ncbi:MAG: hypothetical protein ACREP9_17895 [Candidatus Dormibacteraceae bacterium]
MITSQFSCPNREPGGPIAALSKCRQIPIRGARAVMGATNDFAGQLFEEEDK